MEEHEANNNNNNIPQVKERLRGWAVVAASFVATFIADGVCYSFGVLFVEFLDHFGMNRSSTAWVGSVLIGLPLILSPVSSLLMDRYGSRPVVLAGAVLTSLGYLCSYFVNSISLLCLTMGLLSGVGFACIYVPSVTLVGLYFEKNRALALAIASSGTGLGTMVLAQVIEVCLEKYTWRGTCLILMGICLHLFPCAIILVEPPEPQTSSNDHDQMPHEVQNGHTSPLLRSTSEKADESQSKLLQVPAHLSKSMHIHVPGFESHGPSRWKSLTFLGVSPAVASRMSSERLNSPSSSRCSSVERVANGDQHSQTPSQDINLDNTCGGATKDMFVGFGSVLKSAPFCVFLISNVILYVGYHAPYYFIKDQVLEYGISPSQATWLVSILGICNVIGQIILGAIADRPKINVEFLYSVCIILCGLVTVVEPLLKSYYALVVYSALYGLFISANYALGTVILVEYVGIDSLVYSFGVLMCVQGVAHLFGPPMSGFLYDSTGSYNWTFYTAGILILLSSVFVIATAIHRLRVKSS